MQPYCVLLGGRCQSGASDDIITVLMWWQDEFRSWFRVGVHVMQAPGQSPFDSVDLQTSPANGHGAHPCSDVSPTEPQTLQVLHRPPEGDAIILAVLSAMFLTLIVFSSVTYLLFRNFCFKLYWICFISKTVRDFCFLLVIDLIFPLNLPHLHRFVTSPITACNTSGTILCRLLKQ